MSSPHAGEVGPSTVAWAVVVPVKRLDRAKSRLAVLGDVARQALALAFAEDVVLAAVGCPDVRRILVVTDDVTAARALRALGAEVVADQPDAGLNAALEHGAALLAGDDPSPGVAAVSADLPALRAEDLTALLRATRRRAVVPDAAGSGTTVLLAASGELLQPSYGPQSLARHLASGAEQLTGPAGAQRDVDTPADLEQALALGVGPRTAAVATRFGLLRPATSATASGGGTGTPGPGQGTMHP
jgi:2-phospho-L-lactate/phosphoenolpyruvate guanylyltransferase